MLSSFVVALLLQQAYAQLGDILSYKVQRYYECSSLLNTCQPTISTCANIVCAECTDLGQTAINSCCSEANPQSCFIAGGGGSSNYITTAPDPNLTACSTALNAITTCEAETPGFSNLANSDEASCLCYQGATSWDPMGFDGPWSSCVAWAQTADTSVYAELLANAGMCASVGNILDAPASPTAAQTTGSTSSGGAKATVTSAKATPAGGSQSVATATSSSAKATSSSSASKLERVGIILGAQLVVGLGLGLLL